MRNKLIIRYLPVLLGLVMVFVLNVPSASAIVLQSVPGQATFAFGTGDLTIGGILRAIVTLALEIAGVIAIAFVVYGGYLYMTAGGNEDRTEQGKRVLTNAIIGLAIIILSWVILVVIVNAIDGNIG